MKHYLILFAAFVAFGACEKAPESQLIQTADARTLRTIANGQIIGSVTQNGSYRWAKIPFATPPVGDLRWRAPIPAANWKGVRQSLDASRRCVQKARSADPGDTVGALVGTEDCLYLNVWAPSATNTQKRPVMVFIHGGSNIWGYGGQYNSEHLAKRHDLVVVTINYRLGPLGWLSHPALQDAARGGIENSPNYAVLDMILALKWVQENITTFGGDAQNVTIFGESAGGQNVASLLAIAQAQGLFHQGIVQSGYFTSRSINGAQNGVIDADGWHYQGSHALTKRLHVPAALSNLDMARFLRQQSPKALFAAAAWQDGEAESPLIIRDGILIPKQGLEYALQHAPHPIVPLITGTNRDEMKLFNIAEPNLTKVMFGFLPRARNLLFYNAISKHQSTMWRVRSVDDQARRISARQQNPVFAYRFDWDEEASFFGSDFSQLLGAAHIVELPFVFGGFDFFPGAKRLFPKSGKASRDALSNTMQSYWAEFAYTGAPGRGRSGDLPLWGNWAGGGKAGQLMIFDTETSGGTRISDQTLDVQSVYRQLGAQTQNLTAQERCQVLQGVIKWYPETKSLSNQADIKDC